MNRTETAFLLACLTFTLFAMDHVFVGRTGIIVPFLLAGATCFSACWRTAEVVRQFALIAYIRPCSSTRHID